MLRIAEAQDAEPYTYFLELEKLYIAIHHKIKNKKQKEAEYEQIYNDITTLSNKHKDAWSGTKNNPHYNIIKKKLHELHKWLRLEMEEANLFGGVIEKDPAKIMGRSN